MTATLTESVLPELESWSVDELPTRHAESSPPLQVKRSDISFHNISATLLRIVVTVRNRSMQKSASTEMSIQAAPLGAFVPWSPLTTIPVPSLEPGAAVDLQTDVPLSETRPLGDFSSVPPSRVLTAISPDDESPSPSDTNARTSPGLLRRLLRQRTSSAPPVTESVIPKKTPLDLMRLVGQGSVHWAGNLNIFIGGKPVERHVAMALRILAGRVNAAMFVVGSGRDAYRFELSGTGTAWDPELFDMTSASSLLFDRDEQEPVSEGEWLTVTSRCLAILTVSPPVGCEQGELSVHVTQRSSGETAVVEFGFDTAAAGPGCYTL